MGNKHLVWDNQSDSSLLDIFFYNHRWRCRNRSSNTRRSTTRRSRSDSTSSTTSSGTWRSARMRRRSWRWSTRWNIPSQRRWTAPWSTYLPARPRRRRLKYSKTFAYRFTAGPAYNEHPAVTNYHGPHIHRHILTASLTTVSSKGSFTSEIY